MNERLKQLRLALGKSQKDFAAAIHISQPSYTQYETGIRPPRDMTISQICTTFNVNEEWLRTGNGEMFNQPQKSLVDELVREYDLGDSGREMLAAFVFLPKKRRELFMEFFNEFVAPEYLKDDGDEGEQLREEIGDNEKETRA